MFRPLLVAALILLPAKAPAADEVQSVLQALEALTRNSTDLSAYCGIISTPIEEGDAVAEEQLGTQLDEFFRNQGSVYQALRDMDVEDPRIDEAFDRLEEKCAGGG